MLTVRRPTLWLLLLFVASIRTTAQTPVDTTEPYKINAKHLINVKLDIHSNNEWFEATVPGKKFDIRPNVATSHKLSLNYKFLSVGYAYVPRIYPNNNDNDLKGETTASGLSFSFTFEKWIQDVRLSKLQGLYLYNSEDHIPGFVEGTTPYAQLPNLKIGSIRGSTQYKFNPHYSIKAIRSQTEIQLRSAGSLLAGLAYSYYDIQNKSPDTTLDISNQSQSLEVLATAGYYYTLVINRHWYAAGGVTPGVGINYNHGKSLAFGQEMTTESANRLLRLNLALGMGYNAEHLFFGFEGSAYKASRRVEDSLITLATYNAYIQVFVGYRFHAPKELDEAAEKIDALF